MPQTFSRTSNTIVKLSFIGGAFGIGSLFLFGSTISRSPYNTKATMALDQPVPFSHKHHAKELGIDCRYCHTSVESSSYAGVPPTETCMSCHSQIWTNSPLLQPVRDSFANQQPIKFPATGQVGWNKLNSLPDFVFFNHSIHVNKGVSCFTCHGEVTEMQLTQKAKPFFMAWCLDCHRQPEKYIRPKEEVVNPDYEPKGPQLEVGAKLVKEYGIKKDQLTNCSICHR